jgi:uncharacterized phosphatase
MIHLHRLQGQGSIYLIRHGESEGYAQRIIKGRLDLSLSSRGRRQADKTGRWLKTKGIQALLSSPLARAAQTAEIIGRHCGLDSVCLPTRQNSAFRKPGGGSRPEVGVVSRARSGTFRY